MSAPVLADTDLLPEEIKELAREHIQTRTGIVATRGRSTPGGGITDDVLGAVPRSRRFRIALELPRSIKVWLPGLGDVALSDLSATIEGGDLILDYEVAQR